MTNTFHSFLRQRARHQLDRIMIDECHVLLDHNPKFREEVKQLGQLTEHNTQLIFLTATLPPSLEPRLWKLLHLDPTRCERFRDSSTRLNIQYGILRPETGL